MHTPAIWTHFRFFASMVERLLRVMKEGKETESIQSEIDQSIYSLYGLASEEIAFIESKQEPL